jgi:DNA repair photolyase
MEYRLISCNSLIKKITKKDTLFNGVYCVDPYQNCEFECQYCDSSLEKKVYVKTNAPEILEKEIKHQKKGVIIIGSVNDPYQKADEKYEITKNLLKTIKKHNFTCHILTKSTLIQRDINLLKEMKSMVTVSIPSLDENILYLFEKNVPSPEKRFETVKLLVENKIKTGVAMIPIIPYLTETDIEQIIRKASLSKAQYFLHKHLELKGDQKIVFRKIIQTHYPHILPKIDELYKDDFKPDEKFIETLDQNVHKLCKKYGIPEKIENKK